MPSQSLTPVTKLGFGLACLLALPNAAIAQQAVHTPSATQPSTGTLVVRPLVEFRSLRNDPTPLQRELDDISIHTWFQYGVTNNLAMSIHVPVVFRDQDNNAAGTSSKPSGFGDLHVMAKLRVYQKDFGPIETARVALMAGLDVRTGSDPFGSDSFDPMIGTVYTLVSGRHGFNAAARWKFTTGQRPNPTRPGDSTADLFNYDAAYLYRLDPAQYAADTHGATYFILEANGSYETNGDNELFIAPGIMYEASRWAWEASVQLPLLEDLDHRPETRFTVTTGIRLLF